MRKFIIVMVALLSLYSCIVRDKENVSDTLLSEYAQSYLKRYVSVPFDELQYVLLASEYEAASEEEREDSRYDAVRELRHLDNDTWYLFGVGTFKQNGSVLNTGNSGKLERSGYDVFSPVTIVNDEGKWKWVHKSDNEYVTAIFSKPSGSEAWNVEVEAEMKEGDLTVEFRTSGEVFQILETSVSYNDKDMFGQFDMEIFRSGQMIDYCYLKYIGEKFSFQSSR